MPGPPGINGAFILGRHAHGLSDTVLIAKCEDFILAYQALVDAAREWNETAYEGAAGEADRLINQV